MSTVSNDAGPLIALTQSDATRIINAVNAIEKRPVNRSRYRRRSITAAGAGGANDCHTINGFDLLTIDVVDEVDPDNDIGLMLSGGCIKGYRFGCDGSGSSGS